MAVVFKDVEGFGNKAYLVDFKKKAVAMFVGGKGIEKYVEELKKDFLENDSLDGYLLDSFFDKEGQKFLEKVANGEVEQVDYTLQLAGFYEPVQPPVEPVWENVGNPQDEVFFYSDDEDNVQFAVSFFRNIWAPVSHMPSCDLEILISSPLTKPVSMHDYGGAATGWFIKDLITQGRVSLVSRK